ncbi:uncharacterized protein PV07_00684 [Cladophialophora immunda]|uniref:Uncharacterized protein n=1 Tax=Cladophialophora immunda TaxID=569365 RepID=A0A0D2DDU3_9EURO|nr:uncharacterized protein PV07_00684 [Cladophialophora immunda]KIW33869.1 hypothetical protein PV07_00684 [Cladophialophora immunda]OQU94398.1 hypothetical protein CLAIMM_00757 [Cladophialophora immunda]
MSPKTVTTFLLSSLIYSTTRAFVPLDIHPPIDNNALQPVPSDLDTVHWVPIATLEPISITPYPASSVPTPTPSPLEEENEYHILPLGLDANAVPELRVRQVTGQGAAAAAPTAINQVSPITTYYINKEIAPGQVTQVPVVYTQTFVPIPDQWSSAGAGTIGLGTISGTVGQVRSKRSLPTQAPLAGEKPVQEGSVDEDVRSPTPTHTDAVPLAGEQKAADSPAYANDARRALQAGTLAVLAVGIATMCVSYL